MELTLFQSSCFGRLFAQGSSKSERASRNGLGSSNKVDSGSRRTSIESFTASRQNALTVNAVSNASAKVSESSCLHWNSENIPPHSQNNRISQAGDSSIRRNSSISMEFQKLKQYNYYMILYYNIQAIKNYIEVLYSRVKGHAFDNGKSAERQKALIDLNSKEYELHLFKAQNRWLTDEFELSQFEAFGAKSDVVLLKNPDGLIEESQILTKEPEYSPSCITLGKFEKYFGRCFLPLTTKQFKINYYYTNNRKFYLKHRKMQERYNDLCSSRESSPKRNKLLKRWQDDIKIFEAESKKYKDKLEIETERAEIKPQ